MTSQVDLVLSLSLHAVSRKLEMCGIHFYYGLVLKNSDSVRNEFGSVEIEKRGSVWIL